MDIVFIVVEVLHRLIIYFALPLIALYVLFIFVSFVYKKIKAKQHG